MAVLWPRIVWIVSILVIFVNLSEQQFCPRILFRHGKEDVMPYVQLEGVYAIFKNGSHPIYKHEVKDYFFEYNSTSNYMYFSQLVKGNRSYIGFKAEMTASFKQSDWTKFEETDFPFRNLTKRWFYNEGGNAYRALSKREVFFFCVKKPHVYRCTSERLFFTSKITRGTDVLHDPTTDYFSLVPDAFKNNRRVYQHSKQKNWFLFYQSAGYWVVGSNYLNPSPTSITFRILDNSIHPELTSFLWKVRRTGGIYVDFDMLLRCRGISRRHTNGTGIRCRDNNPCLNGARCEDSQLNQYFNFTDTICHCPYNFKGLTCSERRLQCSSSTISPASNEYNYIPFNHTAVGDVATVFNKSNSIRGFYYKQCQSSNSSVFWNPPGIAKKPTPQPTRNRFCPRMYFSHGKEDAMPYVQLEGVYGIFRKGSHPIYKHEVKDYFFEYNSTSNFMYFSQLVKGRRSYMGVKAEMTALFKQSDWTKFDNLTYPYRNMTKRWLYNEGALTDRAVSNQKVFFICVKDFFHRCTSERLFFNATIKRGTDVLHDPTTDFFSLAPNAFKNNRRVYQHSRQKNWFLFYQSAGYWVVGSNYLNPSPTSITFRVLGFSIHPEFSLSSWKVRRASGLYEDFHMSLKCRGISRRHTNGTRIRCRDNNPCLNGAKCGDSSLNTDTICHCPYNFKGLACSERRLQCSSSTLSPAPNEYNYIPFNHTAVGDVATVFKKSNGIRGFYYKQCQSSFSRLFWNTTPQPKRKRICSRMYFSHGKEDTMPYVQLEGVYARFDKNGSHPVYKHEERNYFFEYNSTSNFMYFSQLVNGKRSYMGVKAEMSSTFKQANWMDFITKAELPFSDFTKRWWYSVGGDEHSSVGNSKVYFKCASDNFYKCSSGRLFFNSTIKLKSSGVIQHDRSTDYFGLLPDAYVNNRRVYQHSSQKDWFLFYQSSGHWVVGSSYKSSSPTIYFKVEDSAIHPEFISHLWHHVGDKVWTEFGLQCRGVSRRGSNGRRILCADHNPCRNNAKCVDNPITLETVCLCPDNYTGFYCDQWVDSCSPYMSGSNELHYHGYGTNVGDIVTVFCSSAPKFLFQQCQSRGTVSVASRHSTTLFWSKGVCEIPFNFDNYIWSMPVILAGLPLLQILIPLLHIKLCCYHGRSILRLLSIHAYITFLFWITYYVVLTLKKLETYGTVLGHLKFMAFVMIGVSYIFMFIESFFAAERKAISNLLDSQSAMEYINSLGNLTPRRFLSVECWHRKGGKKVVTHTEEAEFPIGYSRTVSPATGISRHGVTLLELSHNVNCGDEETARRLEAMKEDMLTRNKGIDTNITFKYRDEIEGLQKELCVSYDAKPCWMNVCCFWFATILGLGWPYRWLFRCNTKSGFHEIEKQIFLQCPGSEVRPQSTSHQKVPYESQDGIGLVNMAYANAAPQVIGNNQKSTFATPAGTASAEAQKMPLATLPGQPIITSAGPAFAAPDIPPS